MTTSASYDFNTGLQRTSTGKNNQTTTLYYFTDSTRQKYAGMERDSEGVDHTLWRKYESRSGRWTSPDPYSGSMSVGDPQSFNRYSYVQNDPVNATDPTGLITICTTGANGNITCRDINDGSDDFVLDGVRHRYGPRDTVYIHFGFDDLFSGGPDLLSMYRQSFSPRDLYNIRKAARQSRGRANVIDQARSYQQAQQKGFDDCAKRALSQLNLTPKSRR